MLSPLNLRKRRKESIMNKQPAILSLLVLFGIIFFGNMAFNKMNIRLDITEEKLYTLSQGSKNILGSLEEDVDIKLFFSAKLDNVPPLLKNYYNRVKSMLIEFQEHSDLLTLEFIDPEPDSDEELTAQRYGIQGQALSTDGNFYFGLVITNFNGEEVVPYLDFNAEDKLEYELIRRIYMLSLNSKPKVGLISSLDILGSTPPPQQNPFGGPPPQTSSAWLFTQELSQTYTLEKVDPTSGKIPDDIDLLMVIHAKNLDKNAQFAIDQHLMAGKNLIVYIDPLYMKDQQQQNRFQPPATDNSFRKLFEKWGIEFNSSMVASDPLLAFLQRTPQGANKLPFVVDINKKHVSKDHMITANLNNLRMLYPGSFKLKEGTENITFEPLVSTTKEAINIDTFRIRSTPPQQLMTLFDKQEGKELHLAGLFTGKFKSAFDKAPEGNTNPYLAEVAEKGHIAVVGDVDMLEDSYWAQRQQFFGQTLMQVINQNAVLNHNLVERFSGNDDLISLRSRGRSARPFDKVLEMEEQARKDFQAQEQKLQEDLSKVEKQINDLVKQADPGQKIVVNKDVQAQIKKFQAERVKVAKELRHVRKNLRSSIDDLGTDLHAFNILFIPVLIAMYGIFFAISKSRRVGS